MISSRRLGRNGRRNRRGGSAEPACNGAEHQGEDPKQRAPRDHRGRTRHRLSLGHTLAFVRAERDAARVAETIRSRRRSTASLLRVLTVLASGPSRGRFCLHPQLRCPRRLRCGAEQAQQAVRDLLLQDLVRPYRD
jgi:hypothetical protein